MKYKIFKQHYHDKYGNIENTTFFVKKRKSFFGITYWRRITHTERGYGDRYTVTTKVDSEEKALKLIQNVLCKEIPRNKWIITPIEEVSCK